MAGGERKESGEAAGSGKRRCDNRGEILESLSSDPRGLGEHSEEDFVSGIQSSFLQSDASDGERPSFLPACDPGHHG